MTSHTISRSAFTALIALVCVAVWAGVIGVDASSKQSNSQTTSILSAANNAPDFSALPPCETMFRCRYSGKCVNSAAECAVEGANTACTRLECVPPAVDINCGRLRHAFQSNSTTGSLNEVDPRKVNSPIPDASGTKPLGAVEWDAFSGDFEKQNVVIRMGPPQSTGKAETKDVQSYIVDLSILEDGTSEAIDKTKKQHLQESVEIKFWVYPDELPSGTGKNFENLVVHYLDQKSGKWKENEFETRVGVVGNGADREAIQLVAKANHFTSFAVLLGGGSGGGDSDSGGNNGIPTTTEDWVIYGLTIGLVVLVLLVIIVLIVLHLVSPGFRRILRGTHQKKKSRAQRRVSRRVSTMADPSQYFVSSTDGDETPVGMDPDSDVEV